MKDKILTGAVDVRNVNAPKLVFYADLHKRRVVSGNIKNKVGKLMELVCKLGEPYPEAVGIIVASGGGYPDQFVPWENVSKIDDDAIFIQARPDASRYPRFEDQPGWILVSDHLMGRTILDLDGRSVEVVNDVHLLVGNGRMLIVHVDISFNGFLRRWGLARFHLVKDNLISWRYVQPLSTEDVGSKSDTVTLSVTHNNIKDLPVEDLADALEELSGKEQEAVFAALNAETAAEVLADAEPRAQRQLIEDLRHERAGAILEEMSVPQVVDLFSALPHNLVEMLTKTMPSDKAKRVHSLLEEHEAPVGALLTQTYVALAPEATVENALAVIRNNTFDATDISYLYTTGKDNLLLGVVDLRELVLAAPQTILSELTASPVVSVMTTDQREDLTEIFAKYHFRMVPVVNESDHLLGVVHYNDVMKGLSVRPRV